MRRSTIWQTLALAGAALLATGGSTLLRAQDSDDLKRGVARISLINGDVSVRRGDSGDWVAAAVNAPVMAQDRIGTGANSRVELQLDSANFLRAGSNVELNVAELENRRFMLQISHGTVTFRVLRDSSADAELDTPNVSVRPSHRGTYRVTVHENGETEVTVRSGDIEIFSPQGSQHLTSGQTLMARGSAADPEFQIVRALDVDDWDRWNDGRDQLLERSVSYRYVSRDVNGAEDLDSYGSWVYDAPYGNVWQPRVEAGWAPYRAGRWVWMDWYGWTWVSSDPWGWAPYHYGRWYYGGRGWCWYPGGMGGRHYWSPALVAFFGFGHGVGVGFGMGMGWGNVGWVPLAPYERFSPWWGRSYYGGYRNGNYIDRSVNITNNVNISGMYRNARVANGVTAVSGADFSQGRFGNYSRVSGNDLRQANLVRGQLPAAPGDAHLRFTDRQAGAVSSRADSTRFFSNRQPSQVSRVPFAEQRQSLARASQIPVAERSAASGGAANPNGLRTQNTGRAIGGAGGSVQSQAPASRNTGSGSDAGRGWRQFGDPASGPATSSSPRSSQAAPAARNSASDNGRGWSRFGDPGTASGAPSTVAPSNRNGAAPSNSGRYGSTPSQAAPASNGGGNGGNSGWRRFGDTPSQSSPAPRNDNRGAQQRYVSPAPSAQQRYNSPAPTAQQPSRGYERQNYQAPVQQSRPSYSGPRQESIRIAPPVVRERSGGGGGGASRSSGGGSAPNRGGRSQGGSHGSRNR